MAITKRFASEDYVIENIEANKTELEKQISLFDKKIDVLENKKIDSPDIANPGQMIVVKTVDDTGKPTEFEAVNIPKTEGGGITVETDPTVPSWAKQPTKPNYTKSDVGLSNVDNIKQYSAENEPPYPVTSVNGKTGSVQLTASDVEARSNTWTPSASDVGALPNTTKIPSSTSDLTNNSGFITKAVSDLANYYLKTETYSKEELDNKISAIPKFAIEVVSSLPTSNISATTVYLVVTGDEENNIYTEYIYVSGRWEYLGKQTVDLTNYVKRTELSIYYSKTEIESLLEELRDFIPTRLSQLADDTSHRTVTDAEKESWNAKSTFSGSYTDLTNKPSIPSLNGYATENFVKGYAQPAGNYLTTIPSEYITESELNAKKYLTSVPGEYITESELSAKGYLTQHQSLEGYAKTSQIPTKTSQLTNDSDFATNESFNKIGGTVEITSSNPEKENTVLTVNPETIDEINLYSAEEIDNLIESVRNGGSSGEIPSLDGYATETYVKNYAQPKGNYLSSVPSEYVTDTELNSKGYLTSIPDDIVTHKDDTSMHVVYGVCETAGDVADKVVSVNGNFILKEGAIVIVRFINANSIATPTLNVNGTGAKPMYRYGTTTLSTGTTTTGWIAGAIQMFTYNGEGWIRDYWNNTTYSNVSLGQGYTTCSTAAATTAKTASLSSYSLTTGGIVTVKFTNAVPANATLNINSKGAKAIYYRGAKITADVIKSGDTATFIYNSYYHLISIDRWQDDIDELSSELNIVKEEIADLNFAEGETVEEALAWLETNGDATKAYVLPDGFLYCYEDGTESDGLAYTNRLPLATGTDRSTIYGGDYNSDGVNDGYKTNTKLSGSGGGESTSGSGKEAMCSTGFLFPVAVGDKLRIKNVFPVTGSNHYVVGYDSSNTRTGNDTLMYDNENGSLVFLDRGDNYSGKYTIDKDGTIVYTINAEKLGANVQAVRICAGMDENTIITLNEEIKEGSGTTTVAKWVKIGSSASNNETVKELKEAVDSLREIVAEDEPLTEEEKLEYIKKWDAPIYDANIPIFELSDEKPAVTSADKTVDAVYAKYDALMALYPNYITKTDLGVCSDGVTHVYRYDFRESEPHRGTSGKKEWSETKAKAIIVSGIHWEWGGIYSLYNALEELVSNPKLFDLKRNVHLIVLPVCNPYAVANQSVRNANLVEIHRNFEVDFIYPGESGYIEIGERSHGGTEPLSEVETQYIDNIFKANTDASFFLTCHSNQSDTVWGTGFTWASPATYYMCNMHYRLVDKLSKSWMDRFGDTLEQGIADYRTENLAEGDTRLGSAYLSTTNGTETKQATKYGIQATNIEVCDTFWVHGTKANPEPSLSSFTMSRGAETYVNFFLTAFGCNTFESKDIENVFSNLNISHELVEAVISALPKYDGGVK